MAGNEAVTIITTETRNLRALPFLITEDQLITGKEWEDWLEAIKREFRYFKIINPLDKKDALIIYGGKEISRLEKSLPDPTSEDAESLNEYEKLRKKLNDYFLPKRNKHHARYIFLKNKPIAGEKTVTYVVVRRFRVYSYITTSLLNNSAVTMKLTLLWESVIVLCFVVRYFMFIQVLQSF